MVESSDDEETRPLIVGEEQLRKDKEKESESTSESNVPETVFLVASFLMMLTETFSTFFTLAVIRYSIKPSIVHRVTLAYFTVYALLAMVLLLDSYAAVLKHRKDLEEGKITEEEYRIRYSKDITTIASSVFWVMLCVLSLIMEVGVESRAIQMIALVVSILAPLLGAISAFIRAYEVMYEHKQKINSEGGDKAASKTGVWVKSFVFLTIALFEAFHCICHFYEAYLLVGETHKLFYITDMALLTTQAALAVAFVIFYFYEKVVGEEKDDLFVDQHGDKKPTDKGGEGVHGYVNDNIGGAEDTGDTEKGCCGDKGKRRTKSMLYAVPGEPGAEPDFGRRYGNLSARLVSEKPSTELDCTPEYEELFVRQIFDSSQDKQQRTA
ncbi:putative membrane protein [Anaplasma phagocytophilum str. ApNP]|uniref:Putative membrane protein n=1 Tax=Anaplasma phagocytophilum str. ApNP TaxID=1359153 RepID=A0A0F3NKK2_ANAPH|nr:putative membrane protein [Anaplasma phagocytophilum str. ApNP]